MIKIIITLAEQDLTKSNSCNVITAVSFKYIYIYIIYIDLYDFFAYLFSIVSHLIKRTPSYKVCNNFAAIAIHFVRKFF